MFVMSHVKSSKFKFTYLPPRGCPLLV